jgi:uncharacterized membrane protein
MLLILILSLPFLMGCVCGLRSMTGPAIVCWAAHLGWLQLDDSKLAFLHHPIALAVFILLAVGELVADKLPFIPRRTMIGPLMVRILFGVFCSLALILSGEQSHLLLPGAAAGGVGAVAGAFAGYQLRRWLTVGRPEGFLNGVFIFSELL